MHLVVREHERIPVVAKRERPDDRALTVAEAELLLRTCEREHVAAVSGSYRSVKFRSYCGVIQAGSLLVEVLPKIVQDDAFDRSLLLRMIALVSDLPLTGLDADQVSLQQHSVLVALARWFCDELARQLHQGMVKAYVTEADALTAIRGRWRPDIDVLRHAGRPDRMHCEFDELTGNNPYNQVLKAALRRVVPIARRSEALSRRTSQLLASMADVDDRLVRASELDVLQMTRLTQRYARVLMMARWFLSSESPDLNRGRNDGLALLFDMNMLFQRALGVLIRRVLPAGLVLREEGPRRYLAADQSGRPQFQMRPDLCFVQGDKVVAIADAKWKLLECDFEGGRHGVAHADAYQLHAYANTYQCDRVALWYPKPLAMPVYQSPEAVFRLPIDGASDSYKEMAIHRISITPAVNACTWSEAMTREVAQHVRVLLRDCRTGSGIAVSDR